MALMANNSLLSFLSSPIGGQNKASQTPAFTWQDLAKIGSSVQATPFQPLATGNKNISQRYNFTGAIDETDSSDFGELMTLASLFFGGVGGAMGGAGAAGGAATGVAGSSLAPGMAPAAAAGAGAGSGFLLGL